MEPEGFKGRGGSGLSVQLIIYFFQDGQKGGWPDLPPCMREGTRQGPRDGGWESSQKAKMTQEVPGESGHGHML